MSYTANWIVAIIPHHNTNQSGISIGEQLGWRVVTLTPSGDWKSISQVYKDLSDARKERAKQRKWYRLSANEKKEAIKKQRARLTRPKPPAAEP